MQNEPNGVYHFFAKSVGGKWEYLYKLYYAHQVDWTRESYTTSRTCPLELRDGKWLPKWEDVLFETELLGQAFSANDRLRELNGGQA